MEYNIRKVKNGWLVTIKGEIRWDEIFSASLEEALKEIEKSEASQAK